MDSHLSSSSTAFDQDPVIPTILYVVIGYLIGRSFLECLSTGLRHFYAVLHHGRGQDCRPMAKLGRPLKDHQRSTTGKTTRTTYVSCQEMHQRGDFIPSALQSLIEKHEIGGLAQHGLFFGAFGGSTALHNRSHPHTDSCSMLLVLGVVWCSVVE